ncbi:hypothetical protein T484DRAFT_1987939 [Baffinella frigidus]|nr:hypothetical protein T484DRAFT_1987939 [Cryptophyta sp. CCMP2293]
MVDRVHRAFSSTPFKPLPFSTAPTRGRLPSQSESHLSDPLSHGNSRRDSSASAESNPESYFSLESSVVSPAASPSRLKSTR